MRMSLYISPVDYFLPPLRAFQWETISQGVTNKDKLKLKVYSDLTSHIFDASWVTGNTVPHWKSFGTATGEFEPWGICCGSTFNICQGISKITNLIHKLGSVDYQLLCTAHRIPSKRIYNSHQNSALWKKICIKLEFFEI